MFSAKKGIELTFANCVFPGIVSWWVVAASVELFGASSVVVFTLPESGAIIGSGQRCLLYGAAVCGKYIV